MPTFILKALPFFSKIPLAYILLTIVIYQNLIDNRWLILQTIPNLENKIEQLEIINDNLEQDNKDLSSSITRQNAALIAIQQQSETSSEKLQETIRELSKRGKETIRYIESAPIVDSSCEASMQYLYDQAPKLIFDD